MVAEGADAVADDNTILAVFAPSGKQGRFPRGTSVLDAARQLGVDLDTVCGGRGICGRCQINVSEGEFAKYGITSATDHLTNAEIAEKHYRNVKGMKEGRRLGCQARIKGNVVIDVPEESQVHRQVVRKRAEARDIIIDPTVTLHYVEVAEADMDEPSGDLRRLEEALFRQWELTDLSADNRVVREMQDALRDGNWKVTAGISNLGRIIAVWPGYHETPLGIAYDVGSTTIAAHLCDLSTGEVLASGGLMNPQIRFGEDLMSRVSYVMMNPGGDRVLTQVVREALNTLAADVAGQARVSTDDILSVTLVGNPVMHHLLLGLDPVPLGSAPFALAIDQAVELPATDLDLTLHAGARAYILPCIAGHVGADTAAVVLSEAPHLRDEITLIVDVGTNAEIVLGNKDRLLACSSPTGPAFEGAQISSGQRAAPGAIERVRIDPDTLEPRFKVIGSDLWSNEAGFDDAVDAVGITGICGSGIIEAIAEMFLSGIISADGVIVAGESQRILPDDHTNGRTFSYLLHAGEPEIRVYQNDVRAIQLAKGALYAGARLLMDRLAIDTVDRILLAGAFGSHIDVKYAMILGLIPDCALDQVQSAGNAAGTGARIALLNKAARGEIETLVRQIEKIETAVEPAFQNHFIEAMAFPHKTRPYPNLAKVVALPVSEASIASSSNGTRRRRRRTP